MLGREYPDQECSAARALEIVGERWSLLILRDAMFRGTRRFGDFQESLQIATNILSARLSRFVETGLMRVEPESTNARRREYQLTDKGLALMPVIVALTEWGDRWIGQGPVDFVDPTGAEVRLELRSAGAQPVHPSEVSARRRP